MVSCLIFICSLLCSIAQAYILSGYLCPTCPSATNPNSLIANLNKYYTHVNIAFAIFNSDGTIVNQFNDASKNFTLTQQMVSDLQSKGVLVFISIGGGAGSTLDCSQSNNVAFMNNFVGGLLQMTKTYGFDGVDFDIEHRQGDYVLCAQFIANVMDTLHANGLKVSMAPQMTNLYPELTTVSGGFNELAPLVAITNSTVLEWIQVQMYNTWSAVETVSYAEQYTAELSKGYDITADGKQYFVQVPPSQLLLGYPASPKGAGSGYIEPSKLKSMYSSLVQNGYPISGFMTWSIGWDEQNDWNFANTLGGL